MLTEIGTCQRICDLFSLRFVVIRLKVIENSMLICFSLLLWVSFVVRFYVIALPFFSGLLFEPLLLYIILLSFYRGQFFCSCRQNIYDIHATSTCGIGRLFPISRHTHPPELPISTSRLHARTCHDEYVCPAACPFSQASLLLIEKLGSHCKTFSHTRLAEL